eukprot:s381_g4.t4
MPASSSPVSVLPVESLEGAEESGSQAPPESDKIYEQSFQVLVAMQATRPNILRGIPVHRFLQRAPRMWARGDFKELYGLSEVSTRLDEFWSHSWRTKAWLKYVNILYLHNSQPAFVVGMFCASAALMFCRIGILPFYVAGAPHSFWCSAAGAVGYYLTLLLWRRRKLAFLDVGCIDPTDDSLKREGLLSLGAFLKNSESLLVLWDETYVARLWCMFEMAAFLRSRGLGVGTGKCLVVCPVFVGPALLVGQLGASIFILATLRFSHAGLYVHLIFQAAVAFPSFLLLAYLVLAHYHNVEVVQDQVGSLTIKDSACYCCSRRHVQDGVEMICDRVVIVRCIEAWFGSVEHFETAVRGEVRRAMVHQLANNVFSYRRIVQGLSPIMWFHMDLLAPDFTAHLSLAACTYVFTLLPIVALICLRLCHGLRKLFQGSLCCRILLSTVPLAVGILTYAIFFYVDKILLPSLLDVQYFHSDPAFRQYAASLDAEAIDKICAEHHRRQTGMSTGTSELETCRVELLRCQETLAVRVQELAACREELERVREYAAALEEKDKKLVAMVESIPAARPIDQASPPTAIPAPESTVPIWAGMNRMAQDTNHDGVISADEWAHAGAAPAACNGSRCMVEGLAPLKAPADASRLTPALPQVLPSTSHALIPQAGYTKDLRYLQFRGTQKDQLFQRFDTNHDGMISPIEFVTHCPQCGNQYLGDSIFCRICGRKRD